MPGFLLTLRTVMFASVWSARPGFAETSASAAVPNLAFAGQVPTQLPGAGPAPAQIPGGPVNVEPTQGMYVTGNVTDAEAITLPANAVVQVTLQDISLADAPAVVLGEQTIETGVSQVPFPSRFRMTTRPSMSAPAMPSAPRSP